MSPDLPGFEVAPWELCWQKADPGRLGLTESTFALSNGFVEQVHVAVLHPRADGYP